jgi:hypothetical protein
VPETKFLFLPLTKNKAVHQGIFSILAFGSWSSGEENKFNLAFGSSSSYGKKISSIAEVDVMSVGYIDYPCPVPCHVPASAP